MKYIAWFGLSISGVCGAGGSGEYPVDQNASIKVNILPFPKEKKKKKKKSSRKAQDTKQKKHQ